MRFTRRYNSRNNDGGGSGKAFIISRYLRWIKTTLGGVLFFVLLLLFSVAAIFFEWQQQGISISIDGITDGIIGSMPIISIRLTIDLTGIR